MKPIKLAVIGADQLLRDSLRASLPALESRFLCVLDRPCDGQVVKQCRSARVELVVFDLHARSALEFQTLRQLASASAWALLVIGSHAPDHLLQSMVTRRRSGFISRSNSLEALARAAFLVVEGGTYLDHTMHELLLRRTYPAAPTLLSQRERHVLQLVAQGYSTKEVAVILRLSTKTVDKYRTSVMQKINVHDVVRLTHYAIRMGFISVA